MMPFLYFPEDKTEYIPAVFYILITFVVAVFVMIYIIRHSHREEQKAKIFERQRLEQLQMEMNDVQQQNDRPSPVAKARSIQSASDS